MSEPLRVVAGIIIYGDQVLACRRDQSKASAGKWEFPGGKIEIGETPEAALIRELSEELGISVQVLEHFDTSLTQIPGLVIQLECYVAHCDEVPKQSSDHDLLALYKCKDLASLDWAEPDLPAVAKLAGLRL